MVRHEGRGEAGRSNARMGGAKRGGASRASRTGGSDFRLEPFTYWRFDTCPPVYCLAPT